MSFFDLDPAATQNAMDRARLNPLTPGDVGPAWYAGAWKAPVTGLASVLNDVALLAGDAGTTAAMPVAKSIDKLFDSTKAEDWLRDQQQIAVNNIKDWAPDPRTTGIAGQVVHGLFNVVPEAIPGPEVAAALQGYKGYRGGMADGLDPGTALGKGAIDAVSTWVGLKIPMKVGTTAVTNVAAGAGGNVLTGMATRGATSEWLRMNGYDQMADQYKVLDSSAMAVDLLMGGGFGALAHYGPGIGERYTQWREGNQGKILPSDIDTALALNNQLHMELDTAPGIPADPQTRAAHVQMVQDALAALAKDEPVLAHPEVVDGNFVENPTAGRFRNEVVQTVEEHLGADWRALKAELEARGLPTDDIDASGTVRVVERSISMPEASRRAEPSPLTAEAVQPRTAENPSGAVLGRQAAVKIEGEYQPVRWALVDAAQLEATMAKADNQFRDRTRAASEAQVTKIAADPDYNLLTDSPIMDFGAPTLSKDGRIIGGNGRFAGLSRAYDRGTAKRYAEPLAKNLRRYGIDPQAAEGMKKPVLVRVLQNDVDVQRAAIASNEGAGLRMSALEQAKVDAVRLGDMAGIIPGETGDLNTAANRNAIRDWVGQFPETERAALIDKDGRLSAEGNTRLRNAVLFRAYGDNPTLARLVESTDPGARNVASALLRTAPVVAEVKASIDAGALYPLDIAPDIAAAVETLDRIRADGGKVADYLAQGQMFGSELSPVARKVLQFMGENLRSAKSIGDMIAGYYDAVKAAGDPKQADMFGSEPPTKDQLLQQAIDKTGKQFTPGMAELPFIDAEVGKVLKDQDLQRLPAGARDTLRSMYQAAIDRKPEFDRVGRQIAEALGGEYKPGPIKGGARAVDKILADYKGDPTKIKDLLRSSIVVDDPVRALAAVEELRARFEVLPQGFRNLFDFEANPADGYRDAKMNVMVDGLPAEIQVHVPEMIAAKSEVHDLYEARSKIERETEGRERTPEEQAQIDGLNQAMKAAYDAAWASSTSRLNSSSETGAPLRRADSAENARGGSSSQAAQEAGTPGTLPNETGTPSTSKNSTEGGKAGNFIDFSPEGSVPDLARVVKNATSDEGIAVILQERPTMLVPGDGGAAVPASVELARADAEIASAVRESPGYEAAAACALRG